MIWIVIEMLFPALLIILPMSLYRSNLFFMAKFYLRMAGSESARKLYVQCMLIFLLLYHYVYAGGHFGEWGVLISTIPCAVLFSDVPTGGCTDSTRIRKGSLWQP